VNNQPCHTSGEIHKEDLGFTYTGQLDVNNKPCGKGDIVWNNNSNYTGHWKNGRKEGNGMLLWSDGSKYNGEWHDDTMSGEGVLETNDMILKGDFTDNVINGKGKITFKEHYRKGDEYVGKLQAGYMTGYGTYHYSDGRKFTGDFMVNVKHGSGEMKWTEGYSFKGTWKNGKLIGSGILTIDTKPSATKLTGTFETSNVKGKKLFTNSKCCTDYSDPTCVLLYDDGNLFRGECLNDQPNGFGWMIYERWPVYNMSKYLGSWVNGRRDGVGLQHNVNKEVFYGNFSASTLTKKGVLMYNNNSCSTVKSEDGTIVEVGPAEESANDCNLRVHGRQYSLQEHFLNWCDVKQDYTEVDENSINFDEKYCTSLHGKYCENVKRFKYVKAKGHLRTGLGYQEYLDGTIYFGEFQYEQKHGRGVMMYPDNTFNSGQFSFNSFIDGIVLHPNMTVVAKDKLEGGEEIFNFDLSSGKTQCYHTIHYRRRNDCFHSDPAIQSRDFFGDSRRQGLGNMIKNSKSYAGQLNSFKPDNWGYEWSEYDPIYIGKFKNGKLSGPGVRITHSSAETKSVSIGFWSLGAFKGPGIVVHPKSTIIGDFQIVDESDPSDPSDLDVVDTWFKANEKNEQFLEKLELRKPFLEGDPRHY